MIENLGMLRPRAYNLKHIAWICRLTLQLASSLISVSIMQICASCVQTQDPAWVSSAPTSSTPLRAIVRGSTMVGVGGTQTGEDYLLTGKKLQHT